MSILTGSRLVGQRSEAITPAISIAPEEALELAILHDEIALQCAHDAEQSQVHWRRHRAAELRTLASLL